MDLSIHLHRAISVHTCTYPYLSIQYLHTAIDILFYMDYDIKKLGIGYVLLDY